MRHDRQQQRQTNNENHRSRDSVLSAAVRWSLPRSRVCLRVCALSRTDSHSAHASQHSQHFEPGNRAPRDGRHGGWKGRADAGGEIEIRSEIESERAVGGWMECVSAYLRVQCTCVCMCQRVCVRELAARFVSERTRAAPPIWLAVASVVCLIGPFLPPPMLCRHGCIPARQAQRHSGDAPVGQATRVHLSTRATGAEASGGRESQERIADCPTRLTVFLFSTEEEVQSIDAFLAACKRLPPYGLPLLAGGGRQDIQQLPGA